MAANLVDNVKEALQGFPVESVYCWLDSSVALHWIKGGGDYKQFVSNRVRKIQEKKYIQWKHVGTKENPADLGSRGGHISNCSDLWWHGPTWLPFPESWPADIVTTPTKESQAEAKIIREVLGVTVKTDDDLDLVMRKYDLWKAIRICSWVARFTRNCRAKRQQRITGPIKYRDSRNKEGKAYIVLYACSLSRALYLELTKTMETEEFISTLKRFIARKGRPVKIYSDNGRTFVAAAKWLRNVMQDERLHGYLAKMNIKWQFNLSRAPWWGGQFERMVGIVKQAFNKSVGNGTLTWAELQDVLLDVEVVLNNRPLSYVEEDVQLPLLTPNMLQFGRPNLLPDPEAHHQENPDLRKRARYLARCKDVIWRRWSAEYLRGLRERHNVKHNKRQLSLTSGDVVIIKGDEKNRGQWKLGIVDELFPGSDGVIRAVKLRAGKSYLERPIQHLYPLELSCDRTADKPKAALNAEAPTFRPTRDAAVAARARIQSIASDEESGWWQTTVFVIWTFDWDILSIFAFIVVASRIIHICHRNRSVK